MQKIRTILSFSLAFFTLCSIAQPSLKTTAVTVISYSYNNIYSKEKIDTVFKNKKFNELQKFDLFFCNEYVQLPYYVPSNGIYKDSIKGKECNWKLYPRTVKCYFYDKQKRVIRMTVSGSGTESNFRFKYNTKNQIIELDDNGSKYLLRYDALGRILEMIYWGIFPILDTKLKFVYN